MTVSLAHSGSMVHEPGWWVNRLAAPMPDWEIVNQGVDAEQDETTNGACAGYFH